MRMIKGTSNKYLDIDLSSRSWSVHQVSREDLALYIGGKGLALKIFHDRFSEEKLKTVDPLGKENLLIFSLGVMLGTGVPCSARFEVVGRSPLTGLMASSSCGGPFGEACKTAGWDGVIISGRASVPLVLRIDADGVVFEEAGELWGQGTHEVQESLNLGAKEGAAVIGPAGENGVLYANICSGHRFAGRGGLGAVMGSKNLKAVVARGKSVRYEPMEPLLFKRNLQKAKKYILRSPSLKEYRLYGTNSNVKLGMERGFAPVRNFRDRYHPDVEKNDGALMAREFKTRHSACRHCSILCGHKGRYPDGKMRQIPEYETTGLFGSNIENYDPALIGRWNELMNELGMDTISAGGTIAWAMEAGEKGLRETSLRFGSFDNMEDVLKDIAYKRGEGEELARGSRFLSRKYGGEEFAIQVKGLEMAAYDPRSAWGHGLGYAVYNKGGCHLGSYLIAFEQHMGIMPPHVARSKAAWVAFMEDIYTAVNSLQVCQFSVFGILAEPPIPKYLPKWTLKIATIAMPKIAIFLMDWNILNRYFQSVTGIKTSRWDILKAGKRIAGMERWMNLRLGHKAADDTLPARFLMEKETPFPGRNTVVPLARMVKDYYRLRNYDPATGGPKDEVKEAAMKAPGRRAGVRKLKPVLFPGALFQRIYCGIVLAVLGVFIPHVACRKQSVKEELEFFPEAFAFRLGVTGTKLSVAFRKDGTRLKKISPREKVDLSVNLKSLDAAWLLFTFQESTCHSEARGRLVAEGELPHTCTFIRIMDKTEILLLPRFIAARAVKEWEPVL